MQSSRRAKLSHNVALIWVGILIPVLVALLPYAISILFPGEDLSYRVTGPVVVGGKYAFSVELTNGGRNPQQGIEVWLPFDSTPTGIESLDSSRAFSIETSQVATTTDSPDHKFKVVKFSSLRPSEKATLSVIMTGHGVYILDFALRAIRVVSATTIGANDQPDEDIVLLYKLGSWLLLALFALSGAWGIYYSHFMDPKKKEEMILKEIEKL